MLPSIADIFSEKKTKLESDSLIEVDYLFTRWRQIKSQLIYASLFEGSLLNRLKIWYQLQKACRHEKKTYLSHKRYQVPNHNLKKELMEVFNIPAKNIVVKPRPFTEVFSSEPVQNLDDKERSSLRDSLPISQDDVLIFLVEEPHLQNGLYQALNTIHYFKEQQVAHLKFLLKESDATPLIHKQIKKLEITSLLVFASQEYSQSKLLSTCDIAFLPTLYAPHTTTLEWVMAHNRPVVLSTEVSGLESYLNLLDPYVFNIKAPASQIANCLLPLIRSQSLRQKVGNKNAEAALESRQEFGHWDHGQKAVRPVDTPKA